MTQSAGGAIRGAAGALAVAALSALLCCNAPAPLARDFEEDRGLDDVGWSCRTLFRLADLHATSGARSLEIEFYPDPAAPAGQYPGFSLDRFDPDWSGRRALVFDVYNPAGSPLALGVRIDDRKAPPFADRFNDSRTLAPGPNRVVVPLAGLAASGTRRALDLRRIAGVTLFVANPPQRRVLYFDNIRLE